MAVRVGVVGYGTIGRRVALAVKMQEDMELVGVVKRRPDYYVVHAERSGIPVYVAGGNYEEFEKRGVKVRGSLEDLLERVDVVVDATPEGQGAANKPLYEKRGLKQVFQGGEKPEVAEKSFSTLCNYDESVGSRSLRVVSCNTTGLLRAICALNRAFGVERVRAVIIRRAADPREVKRGPVNAIVLNPPRLPSHHAVDVKTVLPWLDIATSAVVVPTTLMHVHHLTITLSRPVEARDVASALEEAPRIILVNSEYTGIRSTAEIMEAARLYRGGDLPELVVFEDSIAVDGREVMLFQAVHQESIVVPENIDAIRALAGGYRLGDTIRMTDESLGLGRKPW